MSWLICTITIGLVAAVAIVGLFPGHSTFWYICVGIVLGSVWGIVETLYEATKHGQK